MHDVPDVHDVHDVHECFARIKLKKYGDCPDHGKLQKCLLRELQNSSTVAAADHGVSGPWRRRTKYYSVAGNPFYNP